LAAARCTLPDEDALEIGSRRPQARFGRSRRIRALVHTLLFGVGITLAGGESVMIRLALMLILFVSLAVVSAAQADTSPSPETAVTEVEPPAQATEASERRDERSSRPRWIPRQARRQREAPVVTPYPVVIGPAGIPTLPF
jgi:hypothetical protein